MTFVKAAGLGPITFSNGATTKAPVFAVAGETDWIDGGRFVAPEAGCYQFSGQTICDGRIHQLLLLDEVGGELAMLAYSGQSDPASNNTVLNGTDILDLPAGAKVWLGAKHNSGSSKTINEPRSAGRLRLIVQKM